MAGRKGRGEKLELDLGRYELRRDGRAVKLERKPMELLILLVGRREQLVSRDEIVGKLWRSDLFIDAESNINNIVRKLRTALRDNVAKPRFLQTVVGKGYRFVGPVRVIEAIPSSEASRTSAHSETRAEYPDGQNERSGLAVLPLVLDGKASDDQGLCLGFADALVAHLGNLAGIDVLPTSALLNVPASLTANEAGARVGARFVVHGGLATSKGQRRLSLELFDCRLREACFSRKCDVDMSRLAQLEEEMAKQIAGALKRPLRAPAIKNRPRYSRDPLAYAEFMQGYRLSSSGDPELLGEAAEHLMHAVTRDPAFSLAHATLSLVCATRHFEFDPAQAWLDKAEFHCRRALELDANLPEAHVANAFLLWGPSKNFQHVEAITELKRALSLQKNLPHAYNRLGTILAHIGLLEEARAMYEKGRAFDPGKQLSHSVVQVYVWGGEYDLARGEVQKWRAQNPGNRYPIYFAPLVALLSTEWQEAEALLEEGLGLLPEEPLMVSLKGLLHASRGEQEPAMECVTRACANPKSFGHAHHTYYQIACILAMLGRPQAALEWLERSVGVGFACWPFFQRDPFLQGVRGLPEFEVLVSSLQGKYPEHLGVL